MVDWKLAEWLGPEGDDMKSPWRSVTSGVPQRSILVPILLNTFISDLDDGDECSLSKFAEDTQLWGAADTPEGHAAIPTDLNRLEKRAHGNLIKFSMRKCEVLHIGRNNPMHQQKGPMGPGGNQFDHKPQCVLDTKRQMVFWVALGEVLPTVQGRWSFLSIQYLRSHT